MSYDTSISSNQEGTPVFVLCPFFMPFPIDIYLPRSPSFVCLFLLTYIYLAPLHLYAFYTNYTVSTVDYIVLLTGRQYIKSDLQTIRISLSFLIPSLFLLRIQHLLIFLPHIKNRSDDKIAKMRSR